MNSRSRQLGIHAVLILILMLTYVPFVFVLNNSFRTTEELDTSFFGIPASLSQLIRGESPAPGADPHVTALTRGYRLAWDVLRQYMFNSIFVALSTAVLVVTSASMTAYVLSRYRFRGSRLVFGLILSTMMVPGVLTLVPSYMLVWHLGLLDTYWVLILPFTAGMQAFAIFVFRSFFASLPEDLFESARLDGAGHFSIYFNIVLPLSLPVVSVVAVMTILSTWNNFLWPFVTISSGDLHVVSSGLYIMSSSQEGTNPAAMNASFVLSSVPLLILFIYATKPFIRGVTSGALKA